jgi:uncharacterized protein (DUF1800 family)
MLPKTDRVFVTHLLKRTSFNVSRAKIDQLVKLDKQVLLRQLIDKAPKPVFSASPSLRNREGDAYNDFLSIVKAELTRLSSGQSGLGDRMLWFWHGLITTSYSKVNYPGLIWRQHKLLAKHALGSFRQLLIEITTDPAMLIYLDGDGSLGTDPNENYARELMELFTMGRGNYSQTDVSAAAKVLSGWEVHGLPEKIGQHYNPSAVRSKFFAENSDSQAVTFLGQYSQFNIVNLIDKILAQPATALYIVKRLYQYFVHDQPDTQVLEALADTFRQSGFQIRPVLSQLFRLTDFTSDLALAGRPRLPMEWLLATTKATGLSLTQVYYDNYLNSAGQIPFDPANVAGWPMDNRWLSASAAMAKTSVAISVLELANQKSVIKQIARAVDPIQETLNQLSLVLISDQTRNQLQTATQQISDRYDQARLLLSLALASPEFALT